MSLEFFCVLHAGESARRVTVLSSEGKLSAFGIVLPQVRGKD